MRIVIDMQGAQSGSRYRGMGEEFSGLIPRDCIRVWYSAYPTIYGNANADWNRQSAELIREAFLINQSPDVVIVSSLFEGINNNVVSSVGRL